MGINLGTIPDRAVWLLLLWASIAIFFWIALDGRFYWHDARYLYAASQYTIPELLAGVWNPQFGNELDPKSNGTFYLLKIGFLIPFDAFLSAVPASQGGFEVLIAISATLCLASAAIFAAFARQLWDTNSRNSHWIVATILFLTSPTLPWLAGKLIAEVMALPFTLLSLWAGWSWIKGTRRPLLLGASILTFCVAILARANMSAVIICFYIAYALYTDSPMSKRLCLSMAAALVTLQGLLLLMLFSISGIGWDGLSAYVQETAGSGKGAIASVLGGLSSAGMLLPIAGLALCTCATSTTRFCLIWFGLTAVSTLVVVSLYQVEARYLVGPLIPLTLLTAIGFFGLVDWLRQKTGRIAAIVVAWTIAVSGNSISTTVLPYEIDYDDLKQAITVMPEDDSILLVPWAYSDFHFIRVLWPNSSTYTVHMPRGEDGELIAYSDEWRKTLKQWYGGGYINDSAELAKVADGKRIYYLGWGVHPPAANLARFANNAGMLKLASGLRRLGGQTHWDQSWVVESEDLEISEFRTFGQYTVCEVEFRQQRN